MNAAAPHVLIVDDNEDAAMSLAMLLELEDIVAETVPDAETALRFVQSATPPVLLIDIGLPGMNGFELAKRLRTLPAMRSSTLIALTGREPGSEPAAETSFDQFWIKPFDPKLLLAELQLVLRRGSTTSA